MKVHPLITAALVLSLSSCTTLKKGYDSVASGTGSAWGAVKNAGGAVVSGTTSIGKKTVEATGEASKTAARLATGKLKAEPTMAEITVSFENRKGVIVLALEEAAAPQHAENFRKQVAAKYYDGQGIHRAVPGALIQTGDPRSRYENARSVWGLGGPGHYVSQEIKLKHKRGSVGMARLGNKLNPTRQSNGSQFYICLKNMPELDGEYTVFARIVSGIELADAISRTEADENDAPLRMVKVESIRMVEGAAPSTSIAPPAPAASTPLAAATVSEPLAPTLSPSADKNLAKAEKDQTKAEKARIKAEEKAARRAAAAEKPKGWFGQALDKIW